MPMGPLVSVIMPAFNAEEYIAQSIRSVLNQTFQNWELIIIDDGSTDKTAQIIRQFSATDDRVKYIFQQNGGQGRARNQGIRKSSGALIAFLDSDDLWTAEKLKLQTQTIAQQKVDLVFSDGWIFSEDDESNENVSFDTITGRFAGEQMFELLFVQNRIPILSVMADRGVLDGVALFDENLMYHGAEDYDLWLKIAKRGGVFFGMEEKLVRYRVHSASTSSNEIKMLKAWLAVLGKYSHESVLKLSMRARYNGLCRDLAAAYAERGEYSEAIGYAKELPHLGRWYFLLALTASRVKPWVGVVNKFFLRLYNSGVYRTRCMLKRLGI